MIIKYLNLYIFILFIRTLQGYVINENQLKRMIPRCYHSSYMNEENAEINRELIHHKSNNNLDDGESKSDKSGKLECNVNLTQGNSKENARNTAQKAATKVQLSSDQSAAQQVETQLADRAIQTARAAEAALVGKEEILEQLQQEVQETEALIQQQSPSLQNAQQNVKAAVKLAQQARAQLKTLTAAVQAAQAEVGIAEKAVNVAQQELAEKNELMEVAKNHVGELKHQFNQAKTDYDSTRAVAYKALRSAHESKVNAQRNRRMLRQRNFSRVRNSGRYH